MITSNSVCHRQCKRLPTAGRSAKNRLSTYSSSWHVLMWLEVKGVLLIGHHTITSEIYSLHILNNSRREHCNVGTFIYRRLQGNQNSCGLQCELAYGPALSVGSAAQLAAADCPILNEQSLDAESAVRKTHLCPRQPHYGQGVRPFMDTTTSAPVANFLQCVCAKNYENCLRVDKVIAMKTVCNYI